MTNGQLLAVVVTTVRGYLLGRCTRIHLEQVLESADGVSADRDRGLCEPVRGKGRVDAIYRRSWRRGANERVGGIAGTFGSVKTSNSGGSAVAGGDTVERVETAEGSRGSEDAGCDQIGGGVCQGSRPFGGPGVVDSGVLGGSLDDVPGGVPETARQRKRRRRRMNKNKGEQPGVSDSSKRLAVLREEIEVLRCEKEKASLSAYLENIASDPGYYSRSYAKYRAQNEYAISHSNCSKAKSDVYAQKMPLHARAVDARLAKSVDAYIRSGGTVSTVSPGDSISQVEESMKTMKRRIADLEALNERLESAAAARREEDELRAEYSRYY